MRTLVLIMLAAGCAAEPQDPCTDVVDHIASCTGKQATAAPEATCDVARAESLLEMSCDQLAAAAAAGKADGWWDSFLCGLGITAHCPQSPGGGGDDDDAIARPLSGFVYKLGTTNGVTGAIIQATDSVTGDTLTITSRPGGGFYFPALQRRVHTVRSIQPIGPAQQIDIAATGNAILYAL